MLSHCLSFHHLRSNQKKKSYWPEISKSKNQIGTPWVYPVPISSNRKLVSITQTYLLGSCPLRSNAHWEDPPKVVCIDQEMCTEMLPPPGTENVLLKSSTLQVPCLKAIGRKAKTLWSQFDPNFK
jgi:hypothetical protein